MRSRNGKSLGGGKMDADTSSVASFGSGPKPLRSAVKYAWTGGTKVDEDNFLKMQQDYLQMKGKERENELKLKQVTAQLARTEEAAKRALLRTDTSAKGGAAQKIIDCERKIQSLTANKNELEHRLEREKKKSSDYKKIAEKAKRKLDSVMKEQRYLVRQLGEAEGRKNSLRRTEEDLLSEEAGRRFAQQQEELVLLREENAALKNITQKGQGPWEKKAKNLEKKVHELQAQLEKVRRFIPSSIPKPSFTPQQTFSEDDWVLEDFTDGKQAFLLDPSARQIFSYPSQNQFPRPVGSLTREGHVILSTRAWAVELISIVDEALQEQGRGLRDVFQEYCGESEPACVQRTDICAVISDILQGRSQWLLQIIEPVTSTNGETNLEEVTSMLKAARSAARAVKEQNPPAFRDPLRRVKSIVTAIQERLKELFIKQSGASNRALTHEEAMEVLHRVIPDLSLEELATLAVLLHYWDTNGDSACTFSQLLHSLEIGTVHRKPIEGPKASSNQKDTLEVREYPPSPAQHQGVRVDILALETELTEARKREEGLRAQNSALRRELADAEGKARELEDVAMLKDLTSVEDNLDAQIKAAWQASNTFKKRYLETRNALDTIKGNHERVLQQLDTTHHSLNEEISKRYRTESELSKLRMEARRVKELENMLQQEREDRVKVERDLLEAQHKALSVPGGALKEVGNLRREILELQRGKSLAERKEAEIRRELLSLRQDVEGVSVTDFHRMERELKESKQKVAQLQIEAQAMADKLDVYRRSQGATGGSRVPGRTGDTDEEKKEEELRIELRQLREVYVRDREEMDKLRALLDRECEISLEARAALETAERELETLKKDGNQSVSKLKRELERRDEKIHQLEAQLKGTVAGFGKALIRSSAANKSQVVNKELGALDTGENVFELQISEAKLQESQFGSDPSTFISVDFFEHDTQATTVATGTSPDFQTTIRYVVCADAFFVKYLDSSQLVMELNQARGWDYDPIATGRMPLKRVIEEVEVGAGVGDRLSFHHVELIGAAGQFVGKLRFGFRLYKPIHAAISEYRTQTKVDGAHNADEVDATGSSISHIRVVIHRCENLRPSVPPISSRPYVSYKVPGYKKTYDTRFGGDCNPAFDDEATFEVVRNATLEHEMKNVPMEVVVYDDADMESTDGGVIGVTKIPLEMLIEGLPLDEQSFPLTHPVLGHSAGCVVVSVGWHQPLQMPTIQDRDNPPSQVKNFAPPQRETARSSNKTPDNAQPSIGAHWPIPESKEERDASGDPDLHVALQRPVVAEIEEELRPVRSRSPVLGEPSNPPPRPPRRHRYQESLESFGQSMESIPVTNDVLQVIPPRVDHWPSLEEHIVIHAISLELASTALACPEVQRVIVVQSFLDEFCSVEQQSSKPTPKAHGCLPIDHAVGYNVMGSVREVVEGMIAEQECVVYLGVVSQVEEVSIPGNVGSRVSMESGGGVKYLDIGMCEIDLMKLLSTGVDLERATFQITSSDKYRALTGEEYLGNIVVTICAAKALKTLL